MQTYVYIINNVHKSGKVLPVEEASVSVLDRGFLYGDLIFETMRAYDRYIFKLDAHLSRLCESAYDLQIQMPLIKGELKQQIDNLISANRLSDAYIRVTLSRGIGAAGFTIEGDFQPTLVIYARPLVPYPEGYYRKGIFAIISSIRQNAHSPVQRYKTGNYLVNALAKHEAKGQGAAEAILLNTNGHIAEGSVSNIFIVEGGKVITPPLEANILPGITRQAVLEICEEERMSLSEETFGADRLLQADEVFLTNSLMEIMPINKIGDRRIGRVSPGEVTSHLMDRYKEAVQREKSKDGEAEK